MWRSRMGLWPGIGEAPHSGGKSAFDDLQSL